MVQGRDDLTPAGPMTILGKVYGPLISKLESDNNEKVAVVHSEGDVREGLPRRAYFFCYDWRRDPSENAELLKGILSAVKASSPGGGAAAVIGHSMGAQIAWSVVNGEPELASSLLLAGGPFGGNWSFMRDMIRGGGTMLGQGSRSVSTPGMSMTIASASPVVCGPAQGCGWGPLCGRRAGRDPL